MVVVGNVVTISTTTTFTLDSATPARKFSLENK